MPEITDATEPAGRGALRRRTKAPGRIALGVCVLLATLMWTVCITSYFVEWSTFTTGPVRVRAAGPGVAAGGPTGAAAMPEERDETHYMFGRGRFMVLSHTPYTVSFAAPVADLNSKYLAWAVADQFFPGLWRFDRYAPGPLIGVRLWVVATICSIPLLLLLFVARLTRKIPEGHCRKCRYDLRGLSGERCPECGAEAAAAAS